MDVFQKKEFKDKPGIKLSQTFNINKISIILVLTFKKEKN